MAASNQPTILVTGASGRLAGHVIDELLACKRARIVAATRTPGNIPHFEARGVEVRYADFDDARSVEAMLEGIDRVLLISSSAVGRRIQQHGEVIGAAAMHGVGRLVYTSAPNPSLALNPLAPEHWQTELSITGNRIPTTILRNNMYIEARLIDMPAMARPSVRTAIESGTLYGASGEAGVSYLSRRDCAAAAAAALLADKAHGVVDISGTVPVSGAMLAEMLAKATGRPIRFESLSRDEYRQLLLDGGSPAPVAEMLAAIEADQASGLAAGSPSGFQMLTGRQPEGMEDYIARVGPTVAA